MTREEAIDIFKCIAYHNVRPNEEDIEQAIKALEEPKTVSIPEGATNGDVFTIMFNKTFPKTIVMYENDESRLTISPIFSREWWETPYKEESEVRNDRMS